MLFFFLSFFFEHWGQSQARSKTLTFNTFFLYLEILRNHPTIIQSHDSDSAFRHVGIDLLKFKPSIRMEKEGDL